MVERQPKFLNTRGKEQGNKMQSGRGATSGSNTVLKLESLDMRSKWGIGKVSHGTELTNDDDDC